MSSFLSVSMKLYTKFYHRDIIVCSPLGLNMVTSYDVNNNAGKVNGYGDDDEDFLSSVHICVVGCFGVLLIHNWDHINSSLSSINRQPKKMNKDTDFSRVHNYFLCGYNKHWKKLVILSDYTDPHSLSTFKRFVTSISGYAQYH